MNIKELRGEDMKKSLEAANLIKKLCGNINERTFANWSRQKIYFKEDESVYSTTCLTESLMSTLLIDAMEQRDVAIFDVPGAYLQTDMPEDKQIFLRIRDELVDIMCEINPDYKPYVQYENIKKALYVEVLREIYGCIESALLWYNFYINTLEYLGFSINTYDRFLSKNMIDGKQCTIVCYVGENKLSHVDTNVVAVVTDTLE